MIEHDLLLLQRSELLCQQAMPSSWYTGARRFIALLLAASYDFDRGHLANVERTIRRPIETKGKVALHLARD
jgi:hypothetical protein